MVIDAAQRKHSAARNFIPLSPCCYSVAVKNFLRWLFPNTEKCARCRAVGLKSRMVYQPHIFSWFCNDECASEFEEAFYW
jgi:hypothetical protein